MQADLPQGKSEVCYCQLTRRLLCISVHSSVDCRESKKVVTVCLLFWVKRTF